jgi:hypothetical protein
VQASPDVSLVAAAAFLLPRFGHTDAEHLRHRALSCKGCPVMHGESGCSKKVEGEYGSEGGGPDVETARAEREFFLVLAIVIAVEIAALVVLLR